jgi:DNA-binding LacI/PurR family transcriptional regulator
MVTRSIGLVLPAAHLDQPSFNPHRWPFLQQLLGAFLEAVGDAWRFSTQVVRPEMPLEQAEARLAGLDAVFFHHTKEPVRLWRHLVAGQRVPTVAFGAADPAVPAFTVNQDTAARVGAALAFLSGHGYRRIVPVGSRHEWGEEWLGHCRDALRRAGLPPAGLELRLGEADGDAAREVARLLGEAPACDALLVDTDLHALSMVQALVAAGIAVPGEIGVMGLSGLAMAMHHPPYLSTVASAYPEMIRFCLREIERAQGAPLPAMHVDFGGEVIPGKTTKKQEDREP